MRQARWWIAGSALLRSIAALTALSLFGAWNAAAKDAINLYAAASTTNIMQEVEALFEASGQGKVRSSFAASSTLARQIAGGAPAHVFLSADEEWMDFLEERAAIVAGTRRNLLGNRLVLIAPHRSKLSVALAPGAPIARALDDGRLVMGDPAHVPAGRYAKEALQALGLWQDVVGKLAFAASVRDALTLVARGEAAAGITYVTDASLSADVRVVATFAPALHRPIIYPVALVGRQADSDGRRFLAFLQSEGATEIYRRHGFVSLVKQGRE